MAHLRRGSHEAFPVPAKPIPPKPMKAAFLFLLAAFSSISANAQSVNVMRSKDGAHTLNGDWSFKYIPALSPGSDADFFKPEFDVSGWKEIRVPANWELL